MDEVANEKFYITTAIPYVNAAPHIGHALEFAQTDAIARFQKLLGKDVFLTTGADENSLKNVQAAEKEGITAQQLCDHNASIFKEFADRIGLSYDIFRKSSSKEEHLPGVHELWKLCDRNGDIYKKKYKGLYCVGCESFYKESELVDGKCPEHNKEPETVEEENYFFRLSKYQDIIKEKIENGEIRVIPEKRRNETLAFISEGLEDFSISRSVERAKGWGIPVPGDESQIIYVWFDALACYITGIGYGFDKKQFKKYWPCDAHVIGKGINRFHSIYWPAMLLSAGLDVPKTIFIHGYVTSEGQKMSKSLGNVVDPMELVDKYGADILRYYLLNEIPTFDDGDFSEDRLIEKTNNELIANFGNFVYRVLSFLKANFNSTVPEPNRMDEGEKKVMEKVAETKYVMEKAMESYDIRDAFQAALELATEGNRYFQSKQPWETKSSDPQDCATTMYVAANIVKSLAVAFWPFTPSASEALWKQLAIKETIQEHGLKENFTLEDGHRIGEIEPLFKKIE